MVQGSRFGEIDAHHVIAALATRCASRMAASSANVSIPPTTMRGSAGATVR